jgi:Flp pilus assembly pilin Flp
MSQLGGFFRRLRRSGARLRTDQSGLEALEYLLIACLIAIASYAAWLHLGRVLADDVNKITYASTSYTVDALSKGGF